jgi:biotin carboxyl carrier protein
MPDRHLIVVDSQPFVAERHANGVVDDDGAAIVRATAEGDGRYRVDVAGRMHDAIAAAAGDRIWIAIDGEVFECRLSAQPARTANDSRLSSPMPATVTAIPVQVGQSVEAGDVLIALEAMKMELPLRAPDKATVAAVHCQVGDLVQPDVVLVELQAEPPDVS